ncbi:hypothetical protein [Streptomyces spectabilis]|uniref:Integral membrane protein n=1 Tax=Streptomyces spectabilis TaxID=68270 RepID=A0A5P2XBM5_STRST|nr:hypothetical protein [Streptomyces spectabilis]MBB5107584.1 hypothetical protein [Streptomyces spectabilis]MCI3904750.1 hypothetical protein [Streptomyces spectabilis]QEV61818.1 hypothetical protein CP982_26450 [Streptomyces spectabilis]GGV02860.1 hypothetical protein GCM10010245_07610 [Streptomyces spectabilis]
MVRRPVAWAGAVVLWAEAAGVGFLNWFLGLVVDKQEMSLAGLDPHAMTVSAWIAGGVLGLCLVLCGVLLARTAVRDRAPGGFGRTVLIGAAVLHALLGAFAVGLVGWLAFAFMMLVLGLIVLTLLAYDRYEHREAGADAPQAA